MKGHRPPVGPWENKAQVYWVAALTVGTGPLTTRLLEPPARSKAKTDQSHPPRLPVAFAAPLRDSARASPVSKSPAVVITLDKAPWHRGALMEQGGAASPQLRLQRGPRDSPPRNVMERFWRGLRRRATPKRWFPSLAGVRATLRKNLCYFQTMRQTVLA